MTQRRNIPDDVLIHFGPMRFMGVLSTTFNMPGLRWADQERASAIRRYPSISKSSTSQTSPCQFCKSLVFDATDFEEFDHQPGYIALRSSSNNCAFCATLLDGLEFPDMEREFQQYCDSYTNDQEAFDEQREVQNVIKLKSPPELFVPDRSFLRFKIMWQTTYLPLFKWSGSFFGISRGIAEGLFFP